MGALADKKCVPCQEGTPPLKGEALAALLSELGNGWQLNTEQRLEKEYRFKDFRSGLAFTNLVGELAEAQGHHPDVHLSWGRVRLVIWTHKAGGLTENDFILAAGADRLFTK